MRVKALNTASVQHTYTMMGRGTKLGSLALLQGAILQTSEQ